MLVVTAREGGNTGNAGAVSSAQHDGIDAWSKVPCWIAGVVILANARIQ